MIDKPREGFAKEQARNLIKKFNITKYPIDLLNILDIKNYKYIEVNNWENNINALLIHKNNCIYLAVNGNHHDHRKRFSIAHEIGHLILNHDLTYYKREITFDDIPFSVIKEHIQVEKYLETEANIFAGEILVPLNILKQEFNKLPYKSDMAKMSEELSKVFNVSKEVISIKITDNLRSFY